MSVGNAVPEYLSDSLKSALGYIPCSALLNGLSHGHQFRRFDLGNGTRSKAGENIGLHEPLDGIDMARTLAVLQFSIQRDAMLWMEFSLAAFSALRSAIGSTPVASTLRASV